MKKDKNIGAAFCDAAALIDKMQRIGILCALEVELEDILKEVQGVSKEEVYGFTFYEGFLHRCPVVLTVCGVGKVNAARGTQMMIDRYHPACILNSGIAGGLREDLKIGDIVVAEDLVQHDFDATAFGYAKGYLCTGEDSTKPTFFTADEHLSSLLLRAAEEKGAPHHVAMGRIATGDIFVSGKENKKAVKDQFDAAACEMESAAVAQVAQYSGIPFGILRVISDCADGTQTEEYEQFEVETAHASAAILCRFIELIGA